MPALSRASIVAAINRAIRLLGSFFADRYHLARWEMLLARVLLGIVLWGSLPVREAEFTGQPHPAGLGQWIDFSWMGQAEPFGIMLMLAKGGLVLYMLGVAAPLGLLMFLVMDISHHTFFGSQGIQGHGGQINSLTALALLVGHLWHAARHGRWSDLLWTRKACEQSTLAAARLMVAATYVVAGLSKIKFGGFDWWTRGENFVLQVLKAQDEMEYTMVVNPLTQSAREFGHFLVQHPSVANAMLLSALLMEVGAFLACTGRVRGLLIGGGLTLFHLGNEWLMGLPFRGNVNMDVILFIMPLSWLVIAFSTVRGFGKKASPSANADEPDGPVGTASETRDTLRQAGRLLSRPAVLAVLLAFFMLQRGEWYPFSHFPMYSILPNGANAVYTTDLQGRPLPLNLLGLDAPTLKKMLNVELKRYRAEGRIRRYSDLTNEHWKEAASKVMQQIRDNWQSKSMNQAFQLHRKDYYTEDGKVVTREEYIATFAAVDAPPAH